MYESVPRTDDVVALLKQDALAQGRDLSAVASDALRNFYAVARNVPPDDEPWERPDYLNMTPEQRAAHYAEEEAEYRRYDALKTPEQRERERQEALLIAASGTSKSSSPEEVIARIKTKFAYLREGTAQREPVL